MPHLTSNLQAVGTPLFIVPTPFFPPYPCACVSPIPGMVSKDFKETLKTCTIHKVSEPLTSFEALIKPFLESQQWNGLFSPKRVPVGYLETNKVFPYSGLRSPPLYIWCILIVKIEHSSILSQLYLNQFQQHRPKAACYTLGHSSTTEMKGSIFIRK